ncbi:MAG: GSCFA domain-containing protein [Cyclobacteriaceae bacterium]
MFNLKFDIPKSKSLINLKDKVVSIGSCFSDNIGQKLADNKFQVLSNPLGTIFNPYSIFNVLKNELNTHGVVENQGVFFHYDAHGEISALTKDDLTELIDQRTETLQNSLKDANWLIITFGTGFVYSHKSTDAIVANCHKVPQSEFDKRLLQPGEIVEHYHACMKKLRSVNPGLRVLLTISPVRHTKDGLHENNVSKGILHHATAEILKQDKRALYFPSYEIQMDELRDYRFYSKDLIHPSQEAIDYIWSRFCETYMNPETLAFLKDWNKIKISLQHRPFQPQSSNHQDFLRKLKRDIENLKDRIDVSEELAEIKKQLDSK